MWNQYERLHNHNKAKHNKTVCIFLGIYCTISHTSPVLGLTSYQCDNPCPKRRCHLLLVSAILQQCVNSSMSPDLLPIHRLYNNFNTPLPTTPFQYYDRVPENMDSHYLDRSDGNSYSVKTAWWHWISHQYTGKYSTESYLIILLFLVLLCDPHARNIV